MSRSFLQQSNINLIPSSNLTGITWAPDGGGQFKTWKQVYSAIEKSITPVNIFLKGDPFTTQFIISDNVYNLNNSNFVGLTFATEPFKLKIQNATLVAVNRLLGNVRIEGYNSFGNVIECTQPDLCVFISELGSQVTNYGSSPLLTATPGIINILAFLGSRTFVGNPSSSLLHIGTGLVGGIRAMEAAYLTDNIISGPGGSLCLLQHDGTINFPFPTQSLFSGTIVNIALGMNGGSGPTSFRPDTSGMFYGPLSIGCTYFDTDINLPIWWTGTIWIDAAGNPV